VNEFHLIGGGIQPAKIHQSRTVHSILESIHSISDRHNPRQWAKRLITNEHKTNQK